MTSENIIEGEVKDVTSSDNGSVSDDELDSLLSDAGEEDEFKTEFVDKRMVIVTRARSLIMYWHQLHQQISQVREGYKLAKIWEDDELKTQYMDQGRPLIKKEKLLNEVVKDVLEELTDVPFLSQTELVQLPKWMLRILNVRIDSDAGEETEAAPKDVLGTSTEASSSF